MTGATKPTTVGIGTWNTEWAGRRRSTRDRVRRALAGPGCDILCITEASADLLPDNGYVVDAGTGWDYPLRQATERKVILWSQKPWSEVDPVGSEALPGGRFVKGITETPVGPLKVLGVCIPWFNAHVRNGRRDRRPWQDHRMWIDSFGRLPYAHATERTIVLGDFNQTIPRCPRMGVPEAIHLALREAFDGFTIPTRGELPGAIELAIDHIAHTPDLVRMGDIRIWPRRDPDNKVMSDHFGVWTDLALRDS